VKARLTLKIRAGARKTEFAGQLGEAWKLHVAAPPVDGKANAAITRFLARLAGVPAASVRIVSGFAGTTKIVEIAGLDSASLERAILESHGHSSHSGSAAAREA
jgi:uncharacterized protein YggU (UPF0235/DUF167 family)